MLLSCYDIARRLFLSSYVDECDDSINLKLLAYFTWYIRSALHVIPLIFYRVNPSWYRVILLFLESLFVKSLKRMQGQINLDADNAKRWPSERYRGTKSPYQKKVVNE